MSEQTKEYVYKLDIDLRDTPIRQLRNHEYRTIARHLVMRGWRKEECTDCKRNVTGLCGAHAPPPYEISND